MSYTFELGPIRPPSEASSILLRVTRNCPWNRCAFCPVYKRKKFSTRTVEEVKQDIDAISYIAGMLTGQNTLNGGDDPAADEQNINPEHIQHVAFWLQCGMKSLFLQDADSLVIKTANLVEILNFIREKIPSIQRVTSYSRAKTVSKKSLDELKALREAGLNRIHIGMESGSAKVLEMIKKGVTPEEQVKAGRKAMAAGFELSEYFMPGIGGEKLWKENAVESARVFNRIDPTFIRLRTTRVLKRTPLEEMMSAGQWTPLSEVKIIEEIKLFIENLQDISSTIVSDHIMNLIEDVAGKMPQDKEKILDVLDRFLGMKVADQESFIIGRRLGHIRHLADYSFDPRIEEIKEKLKARYSSIEEAVRAIAQNY
jgi:biotin synthase-like enzyme